MKSQKFNSYTKEVFKRFTNPKHFGEIKNPDAVGRVGNPQCLLPDEKIFFNGGFYNIKNSEEKDNVISHDSSINEIKRKFFREYKGEIITIKNCLGKISLTPEHLVYALKLPNDPEFSRIKKKKNLIPAWYHAEDLKKKDIILYPIDKEEKDVKFLDIKIEKKKYDFKSIPLPKRVPLNSDLLRLFGYFLAEGHISEKPSKVLISICLNINEKEIIEDIKDIIKKNFKLDVKIKEKPEKNTAVVFINNAKIARFFKKIFGNGAQYKEIPEFIMKLPFKKQKSLIEGLWKGDGYINPNRIGPRAGYVTISYQLAHQIKILLLRQKIVPSFYIDKEREVNGIKHRTAYRIHIGQRDSLINIAKILDKDYMPRSYESISSWFDEKFLYTPITKIEKKYYEGRIYNLEVSNVHSFISEAFSLHNCGDIMEIYLKVKNEKINDIKFKTFGCVSAIAASDALCELAKKKTIEDAKKITNKEILEKLKGLPAIKIHCSVLGAQGLKKAIQNYEENHKN